MKTIAMLAVLAASVWTQYAAAECAEPVLSHGKAPIRSGQLAFHAQNPDPDLFYESNLYVYNFATRKFVDSKAWTNAFNPLNPDFSPEGAWVVFTARIGDGPDFNKHVFAWDRSPSHAPVDLTPDLTVDGQPVNGEDPRFSADGRFLVFKLNKNIAIMSVTYDAKNIAAGPPVQLTTGGEVNKQLEASGPTWSDGYRYIFYYQGVTPKEHLEELILNPDFLIVQSMKKFAQPKGTESYYPMFAKDKSLYFARHDVPDGVDQIYLLPPKGKPSQAAPVLSNFCTVDNSDPAPAGKNLLIFSSTKQDSRYELYAGDGTGTVWDFAKLPEINDTEKDTGWGLLGADYSAQ